MNRATLSEREASQYTGMSRSFLRKARINGDLENHTPGPEYLRVGRRILYRVTDLDAWLERSREGGEHE